MKLQKDEQLFFGCKIDSKVREALAQARPGDRKYFEGESSEFLRICTFAEERWIGKVLKGGLSVSEIEDLQRNIISILRRISPTIRTSASAIKIFHAIPSEEPVDLGSGGDDEEDADASSSDESNGPYISY